MGWLVSKDSGRSVRIVIVRINTMNSIVKD